MELETRHVVLGLLAAVVLGAGYAWYQNQPARDARAPRPDSPGATVGGGTQSAPALYKWRDDAGVPQYSDHPPVGRDYEVINGTPNVNSVPTVVPDNGLPPAAEPQPAP
jgi:hypothetical protein